MNIKIDINLTGLDSLADAITNVAAAYAVTHYVGADLAKDQSYSGSDAADAEEAVATKAKAEKDAAAKAKAEKDAVAAKKAEREAASAKKAKADKDAKAKAKKDTAAKAEEPTGDQPTYEEAKNAATAKFATVNEEGAPNGPAVVKLLAEFGAKRIPEVPEKKLGEFLAALEAIPEKKGG